MKHFYSKLCVAAFALCLGLTSRAEVGVVDGVYQLGSPEDMLEFAQIVLENNGEVDAVLTADIDMSIYPEFSISSSDISYKGVFDGQFHTVTIGYENNENEYVSLFRKLGAGTIKNLVVKGSLHAIGKHCATLVGQSAGNGTIENVVTDVAINTTTVGDGSHAGLIGSVTSSSNVTINNCTIGGSLKSEGMATSQCGGVIGWADGKATLNNVLVICEFEIAGSDNGQWGNLTFVRNPGNSTLNNCYYLNQLDVVDANGKQITAEELESGAACFALNIGNTETAWFQNLGTDPVPVPNPSHAKVFRIGRSHCDGSPYEEVSYSNTEGATEQDQHDFQDGVCTYCHAVNENYLTAKEDGFYELSNAAELCWFTYMVKAGHTDINGRMTAPIDLDGAVYAPIGTTSLPYSGTFNGGMYAISNANMMIFGTVNGATIDGINVQGGVVGGHENAAHTGSVIGHFRSGTLTRSFSTASVENGKGDCGGLIGKIGSPAVISNCGFAGNLTCGWSAGLVSGSTDGNDTDVTISDILLDARNVTYENGDGHGLLVGWFHDGVGQKTSNIWVIEGPSLTDIVGYKHEEAAVLAVTHKISESDAATGVATFGLNKGNITSPVWFQTLDVDDSPTLDPTHGVVYMISEGQYTNDMAEFRKNVVTAGKEYAENVIAYKGDIEAYEAALYAFAALDAFDADVYNAMMEARAAVETSAAAYKQYTDRLEEIVTYVNEHSDEFFGSTYETLLSYIEEDVEPCEEFPNGSAGYIIENKSLTGEQIVAEVTFMNGLLEAAIKSNYQKGTEITNLMVNADLSAKPNFDGWTTWKDGSTLTTGTVEGVMTAGEVWNAKADVHQTLTGLKNGVYELRVNAATRPASNSFNANDNYIAYLYANNDENYIQALTEDMVSGDNAIDGVNCLLTPDANGNVDDSLFIDDAYHYVPHGPVTCAYAFKAGRYENRVLTNVTDGTLTVGLRIPGTGLANDWIGFGNFRLFYLGTTEEATDLMGDGMESYIDRTNTLIEYIGISDIPNSDDETLPHYKSMPNFSAELRGELQNLIAATEGKNAEALLDICGQFTNVFHRIDSCKEAYIELMDNALAMLDACYNDPESPQEEVVEMQNVVDDIVSGWEQGTFSIAEAKAMDAIKNTAFYQRYFQGAPALKGGFYQLATASDMVWFANNVNSLGNTQLNAEIVAPIDLADSQYSPIGTIATPYAGTFKGNLYPITNANMMIFGTIQGGTIDGVNVQGGSVGGSENAEHTGSICGTFQGTMTRCYSNATVENGKGDCGGLIGKIKNNSTVKNCMFAGNLLSGWSAGLVAGATDGDDNYVVISDIMLDARNVTYGNGDGHGILVGWLHNGVGKYTSNIWVIESPSLTDIIGYKHEEAVVKENTTYVTVEEAATGVATYGLNRGETEKPVWFQTLGKDEVPTLSPESKVVILVDGNYVNAGEDDEDAVNALKTEPQIVNVFDLNGRMVLQGVDSSTGLRSLPNGLYIIGGRKVLK